MPELRPADLHTVDSSATLGLPVVTHYFATTPTHLDAALLSSPAIIPVLDVMDGVVVRGVAGERERYRPIQSQLTSASDPLDVAMAIRDRFGLSELYVADLDGIMRQRIQTGVLEQLVEAGFTLNVDAGKTDVAGVRELLERGIARTIIGLESLSQLADFAPLVDAVGPEALVFSLDLKQSEPLGNAGAGLSPVQIAAAAASQGVRRFLVLDLAAVGVGQGIPTLPLCSKLRERYPASTLWTGGGVRSDDDIQEAGRHGVDGVLVATALHDGRITVSQ